MTHKRSEHNKMVLVTSVLIATAVLSEVAYGQSALMNHPVFTKYPSPGELQRRVEQFKREHADEFEAARQDFDLALRSRLELTPVTFVDEPQPVRLRKWPLRTPFSCSGLKQTIIEREKAKRSAQRVAFYRAHFDALCIEFSVAMRIVALDILLNGWDDWSRWDTERLREYRKRYPDAYRIAALSLLVGMNHENRSRASRDATAHADVNPRETGLLLRMLLDSYASPRLLGILRIAVDRVHNDPDALDFVVRLALEDKNGTIMRNGMSCMGSLTESLPIGQQRDFWVQYLDSDDFSIRSYAVSRVGMSIGLLKKDPQELATNGRLAERLRKIAASDPDSRIRLEAQRRVVAYEDDSPPPGLIDYGKGKKDD